MRNAALQGKDRNKAPEEVLLWIMNDIRRLRRDDTAKTDRKRLFIEDEREEKELRGYVIQALTASISNSLSNSGRPLGEENKHQSERDAVTAWRQAHNGNIPAAPGADHSQQKGH